MSKRHDPIYRWTTIRKKDSKTGISTNEHVKVEINDRQAKAFIMKQRGWTKEEYKKHYDIFKNKLRAKEMFEEAAGVKVDRQSPVVLLYKEAKAMQKYGPDYRESLGMQRIKQFSSISQGKKGREALKHDKYLNRRKETYANYTNIAFANMIENMPQAQKIMAEIEDPVKREKALNDLADKLKIKKDEIGKREGAEAVKNGESYGSSDLISAKELDEIMSDYK